MATRPNPLSLALTSAGFVTPEQAAQADLGTTINSTLQQVTETAKTAANAEILQKFISPRQPDPFESLSKMAPLLGLTDQREQRRLQEEKAEREAKEAKERREREERRDEERREEARLAAQRAEQMGFAQMMVQMLQAQQNATAQMIERSDAAHREMMKAIVEQKKEDPIKDHLIKIALDNINKKEESPDPISQFLYMKEAMEKMGLAQATLPPDKHFEFQLQSRKLDIEERKMEKEHEVLLAKAEKGGSNVQALTQLITDVAAARKEAAGNAQSQQQATSQVSPQQAFTPATLPRALYECPACQNQWDDVLGIQHVICPRCKESLEVDYGDVRPIPEHQAMA